MQVADAIRVTWCPECIAYHVLLYLVSDLEPFAMCTLKPDEMCGIIDADFGVVFDLHPKPARISGKPQQ